MRALLIVNPRATSTTQLRRDVIASALASAVKLEVVQTRYRGHATALAASARNEGFGLVLTLGGDGTVNEVVNGLLAPAAQPDRSASTAGGSGGSPPQASTAGGSGGSPPQASTAGGSGGSLPRASTEPIAPATELPAIAALPGGSGNVFTGALGLPRDPIDATGKILEALASGHERTIGLGNADGRYFTFNCGLGFDAEVVRAVQGLRALGRQATSSLYVRLAVRQFYRQTDRRSPAVWIEPHDGEPHGPVFLGIVSNTAPWTYLGVRELNANPQARFDTGLDVLALRNLSSFMILYALSQMVTTRGGLLHGRGILALHDQPSLTLRAERPVAFQIDGEYVGERQLTTLRSVPRALRVVA